MVPDDVEEYLGDSGIGSEDEQCGKEDVEEGVVKLEEAAEKPAAAGQAEKVEPQLFVPGCDLFEQMKFLKEQLALLHARLDKVEAQRK